MTHSIALARAALLLAAWTCFAARAENLPTSAAEIDTLAQRVAGDGDAVTRTQRLVSWMNSRLEWVATDYDRADVKARFLKSWKSKMNLDQLLRRE